MATRSFLPLKMAAAFRWSTPATPTSRSHLVSLTLRPHLKLRPPPSWLHSQTACLPGTRRERSSCIFAGPGSSSSLRATQQSSCWHPPSASPPVLMTFINELRALWILMKLAPQREKGTVCFCADRHDMSARTRVTFYTPSISP